MFNNNFVRCLNEIENQIVNLALNDIYDINALKGIRKLPNRKDLVIKCSSLWGDPSKYGISGYLGIDRTIYIHPNVIVWDRRFLIYVLSHEIIHYIQYSNVLNLILMRTIFRKKSEHEANEFSNIIDKYWHELKFSARYSL